MWVNLDTFLSSFIQCSMGLPYFFSIDGKYDAGPVTFSAKVSVYPKNGCSSTSVVRGSSPARRSPTGYRRIGYQRVGGAGIRCCRPTTGCAPHPTSFKTDHSSKQLKGRLNSLFVTVDVGMRSWSWVMNVD
jgi:hypothetical protein